MGIVAEMLKTNCDKLHDMILDLFNAVLVVGKPPPTYWSSTRRIVIFKKGPSNTR